MATFTAIWKSLVFTISFLVIAPVSVSAKDFVWNDQRPLAEKPEPGERILRWGFKFSETQFGYSNDAKPPVNHLAGRTDEEPFVSGGVKFNR